MTQYARPNADLIVGDWSSAPLYPKIDEVTPSPLDYISSDNGTGTYTCRLGLSAVDDPLASDLHTISWQACYYGTGTKTVQTRAVLLQDGVVKATSGLFTEGSGWVTHSYTLLTAEADSLTDYGELELQIEAVLSGTGTRQARVCWAQFSLPDAPGGPSAIPILRRRIEHY